MIGETEALRSAGYESGEQDQAERDQYRVE